MMNLQKRVRILLAMALALVMVTGNLLTVMAEGTVITDQVKVNNGELVRPDPRPDSITDKDEGYVVNGSINHDDNGLDPALEVRSGDKENPSVFTVTGDVEGNNYPVYVYASDGGTASATVEGSATAETMTVQANAYDQGTTNVTIDKNVTATREGSIAIYSDNSGIRRPDAVQGGTVNIGVGGDVKGGIDITSKDQGTTIIDVDGSVEGNISIQSRKDISDFGGNADLTVGKGVNGQVVIEADFDGKADVTIDGKVKVTDY